jgi:hypothetical protein
MVPLPMGVRHELIEGAEQATLPEEDEVIQTLLADRAHEPFRVRVGIRRLNGRQHDPHPGALDDAAESVGPLPVAIADENAVRFAGRDRERLATAAAYRGPHWNVTVLVPSGLVTMLDIIDREPVLRQ